MGGLGVGTEAVLRSEVLGVERLVENDDAGLGLLDGETEEVTEQALVFEAEILLDVVHKFFVQLVAAVGRRNARGRVVGVQHQGEEILVDLVPLAGVERERLCAESGLLLLGGLHGG